MEGVSALMLSWLGPFEERERKRERERESVRKCEWVSEREQEEKVRMDFFLSFLFPILKKREIESGIKRKKTKGLFSHDMTFDRQFPSALNVFSVGLGGHGPHRHHPHPLQQLQQQLFNLCHSFKILPRTVSETIFYDPPRSSETLLIKTSS